MFCLLIPEFIFTMCISWTPSTTSIETKAKMGTGAKAETKARAGAKFKPKTKAQAQPKPKSEGMAQGKGPTKAKAGDNPHVVAVSNSCRSSTTSIKTKATMVAEAKVETTSSAGAKFKPGTRPQAGSLPPPCCCASWPHLATPGWAWGGGSCQHISLWDIRSMPTRSVFTFFRLFSTFGVMHQNVVTLGGVCVCFSKSVGKRRFRNVCVGGGGWSQFCAQSCTRQDTQGTGNGPGITHYSESDSLSSLPLSARAGTPLGHTSPCL